MLLKDARRAEAADAAGLTFLPAVAELFFEDEAPEGAYGLIVAGRHGVVGELHGDEEGLHRGDAEDVVAEADIAQQLLVLRGGDALSPEIASDKSGEPSIFFPKFSAQTAFIPCHRCLSISFFPNDDSPAKYCA